MRDVLHDVDLFPDVLELCGILVHSIFFIHFDGEKVLFFFFLFKFGWR